MTDHRGFSLIELLVAALLTTMVAAGLFSAYLATARSLREASAQTALQRQGTLALQDIGRQVQSAGDSKDSEDRTIEAFTPGATCNGHGNSVQVNTPSGIVCYYATADGALCEFRGVSCRNLLAGGLGTIALATQSEPPDPTRCPAGVAPGAPCFSMTRNEPYSRQVDVWFAIRDNDGDFDGSTAMSFRTTLTCRARNC